MVAFVLALLLAPPLIVAAPGVFPKLTVAIYSFTIIGLFGISATYHRRDWSPANERLMRRLDHSMIFLAIAGTYTPLAALTLPNRTATIVLATVWGGAVVGIAVRLLWQRAPAIATAGPYVVVGWTAIFVTGDLWAGLGAFGFSLLVSGGALFTIGAVIYATHWPDPLPDIFGYHEVFHLFVIAGVIAHYLTIAFFALPLA